MDDETKEFIQKNFPHIKLEEAVDMGPSGKLWPLCDLKNLGNCQDIALVSKGDEVYSWELEPVVKSCHGCGFHQENCERH